MDSANMNDPSQKIAKLLLQIEAVKLNTKKPFTWTSGIKSPIYCDNRLSLSYPEVRDYIKMQLIDLIKKTFGVPEVIAGVATAGIPQAALVADHLHIPLVYVRSQAKAHGLENRIEGRLKKGQKVIVIEDLISTGKSSLAAAGELKNAGAEVIGLVSIFNYGFKETEEKFDMANIPIYSLTDYSTLIQVALAEDYVSDKQMVLLKSWRVDPQNWKPK